jgi:sugar/nucleoside kinase (ribokinase family)
MHVLFAGLTTFDVVHLLDHVPQVTTKTTAVAHTEGAGGPATNAAITCAALDRVAGSAGVVTLLTALGSGPTGAALHAELEQFGVQVLDAADGGRRDASPAISSVVEHPEGRFVASTNARVPVDPDLAARLLARAVGEHGMPEAVLVDGHNPELAALALDLRGGDGGSPLRILDGGSWKDWFTPLLPQIDLAAVSADCAPPCRSVPIDRALGEHGIDHVIRTAGPDPVAWWWPGSSGSVPVPAVDAVSTMGAGDVFHGALTWTLAHSGLPTDPSAAIDLASRVAALSTRRLGTRAWIEDPALPGLLPRPQHP